MPLDQLRIYNARNLKECNLQLYPSFNIFFGSNGAGKTTILESIYLLLRSRTFRSSKYKTFINDDSSDCTVFSKFIALNGNDFTLAISRSKDILQPTLKLNSTKIYSISTISELVLLGLITPESFNLLDSGPSIRRKFIDWGVFHVEPDFINQWRNYKKVISNRNNLLRQLALKYPNAAGPVCDKEKQLITCWDPQLTKLNNILSKYRETQINNIEPIFRNIISKFSIDLSENISMDFYRGWTKDIDYSEYLVSKLDEDLKASNTRFGTHRSELKILYRKQLARDVLSRGQKKIVVLSLILSQFIYLSNIEKTTEHKILLLDDIDSELDEKNLKIFVDILMDIDGQKMITTTNENKFKYVSELDNSGMFHVKQNE